MSKLLRISPVLFIILALLAGAAFAAGFVKAAGTLDGVPGWQPASLPGFGQPQNYAIATLDGFAGNLWAGTWSTATAQVWRTGGGVEWANFTPGWVTYTEAVMDAAAYAGHLYFATADLAHGGALWRTDGVTWTQVVTGGFGDDNNWCINALAVFTSSQPVTSHVAAPAAFLYAATGNQATGVEVWRSPSGDDGSWQQVNSDGFGGVTWSDMVMDTFQGHLYIGLSRQIGLSSALAELWRTSNGLNWTAVFTDGLGDAQNMDVASMAEFDGYFYIGLRNLLAGGQVWRTSDGVNFSPVFTDGLGRFANQWPGLFTFEDHLYLVFSNKWSGAEVWQSADGLAWLPVMQGGWGDANNAFADYFDKGAAVFKDAVYIGTWNDTGGQVWQMLSKIFLPLVVRN